MTHGNGKDDLLRSGRKVKVTRNGPYIVSGGVPLLDMVICVDAEGECHGWRIDRQYPLREKYSLCRCGQSRSKPFCDGRHSEVGFDGAEAASRQTYMEQARKIAGPGIDLTDAAGFCAEARFCHRAGGTWKLTRRSDDPEARKTAIEEACNCPSGRLVAWDKEGKAIEPDLEQSIGVVQDLQENAEGPLWVRGGIPIESAAGATYEVRNRVTLCRCGRSANKPFCDGRHLKKPGAP